jgi:hypothetical protein
MPLLFKRCKKLADCGSVLNRAICIVPMSRLTMNV